MKYYNIFFSILIIFLVYSILWYIIPYDYVCFSIISLYFTTLIKKWLIITTHIIKGGYKTMNERLLISMIIFSFFPFGILISYFYQENLKHILHDIYRTNVNPELWSENASQGRRRFGYAAHLENVNDLLVEYKRIAESHPHVVSRGFEDTLRKLERSNWGVSLTYSNYVFIKYVAIQYHFSPQASEVLKGLGNGDLCSFNNSVSPWRTFSPKWKKDLVISELRRLQQVHLDSLPQQ